MQKSLWSVLVAAIVIVLLTIKMFTFINEQGNTSVVLRMGRIHSVYSQPGLYARWPSPIDRVRTVDARVRTMNVTAKEVATKDENTLMPTAAVNWRVTDAEKYIKRTSDREAPEDMIRRAVHDARRVVSTFTLDELFTTDPAQSERFQALSRAWLKATQENLARSDYGIEVIDLEITMTTLPASSNSKVAERMISERQRASEAIIVDGRNEAAQIRNQAELERNNMLSEARAEARRIRGEGDAEAAKHYKVFRKNPVLARYLRQLDAIKQILSSKTTVTLPSENPLDALVPPAPESLKVDQ